MASCYFEDGGSGPWHPQILPCLWNAQLQGNGQGRSFILWADPYLDPADSAD